MSTLAAGVPAAITKRQAAAAAAATSTANGGDDNKAKGGAEGSGASVSTTPAAAPATPPPNPAHMHKVFATNGSLQIDGNVYGKGDSLIVHDRSGGDIQGIVSSINTLQMNLQVKSLARSVSRALPVVFT